MLDTGSHFLTVAALRVVIDGLAANKLNALHWKLVTAHSFPFESSAFPTLSQEGAWDSNQVYSRKDLVELVDYGHARGVRVVPELSVPSDAFSWGFAFPDIILACDGVANALLNPFNDHTLRVVEGLLKELAGLFKDRFTHIGGASINLTCWNDTEVALDLGESGSSEHALTSTNSVASFASVRSAPSGSQALSANTSTNLGLATMSPLDVYREFMTKVLRLVGTDKVVVQEDAFNLLSGIFRSNATVVQVQNMSMAKLVRDQGFDVILTTDWSLHKQLPVGDAVVDADTLWGDTWAQMRDVAMDFPPSLGKVLGGEALLPTHQAADGSLSHRIWPRACGVAEALWTANSSTGLSSPPSRTPQRLAVHRCRMLGRGIEAAPVWADFCSADISFHDVDETPQHLSTGEYVLVVTLPVIMVAVFVWRCITLERRKNDDDNFSDDEKSRLDQHDQQPEAPLTVPLLRSATSYRATPFSSLGSAGKSRRRSTRRQRAGRRSQLDKAVASSASVPLAQIPTSKAARPQLVRLRSLDVLRGICVIVMLVCQHLGYAFPEVSGAPWNGLGLADLGTPLFNFIAGIAVVLSLAKFRREGKGYHRRAAFSKIGLRFLKLFFLGLVLSGGGSIIDFDLSRLRVMGTLQLVAISYLFVATCEVFLPKPTWLDSPTLSGSPEPQNGRQSWGWAFGWVSTVWRLKYHAVIALVLAFVQLILLHAVKLPGCLRGTVEPWCNVASWLDSKLFTRDHVLFPTNGGIYQTALAPFQRLSDCSSCSPGACEPPPTAPEWCFEAVLEPNGFVSSLGAILVCLFGMYCGHALLDNRDHKSRVAGTLMPGGFLLAVGAILHLSAVLPLNRSVFSLSFTLLTAGLSSAMFNACYFVVDVVSAPSLPLQWFGMNPLFIFALASTPVLPSLLALVYWDSTRKNLSNILWPTGVYWGEDPADWQTRSEVSYSGPVFLWCVGFITFWGAVVCYMHRHRLWIRL